MRASRFQILVLTFCFLLASPIYSQTPPAQDQSKSDPQQDAKAVLEKKALDLLDQILVEAQGMRLPENRAQIQATVADLMWTHDEKRARTIFNDAISNIALLMNIDQNDPQAYIIRNEVYNLRTQILRIIAGHDPALAREFLNSTRQPSTDKNASDLDASLEMQFAAMIAQKDPKQALQVAEESLSNGLTSEAISALSRIQAVDKESANKLFDDIIKKLKSQDIGTNQQAAMAAIQLLRLTTSTPRTNATPAQQPSSDSSTQSGYNDQSIRDLIDYVTKATISALSGNNLNVLNPQTMNYARNLYNGLQSLLPQIEKYSPNTSRDLAIAIWSVSSGQSEYFASYGGLQDCFSDSHSRFFDGYGLKSSARY